MDELIETILDWWEHYKKNNIYDEEPKFVTSAKKLKNENKNTITETN